LVYAVSSDLWCFIRPFLLNELRRSRWPFVAEETLRDDPELAHAKLRLPWQ